MFSSSTLLVSTFLSLFCRTAWAVTIHVTEASDFSTTQAGPITFELQNNITTDAVIIANQTGTTITSAPGQTYTIHGTTANTCLVLIENCHDITFENVNLQYVVPSSSQLNENCPQKSAAFPGQTVAFDYLRQCSALHVGYSTNVVVKDSTSFGRFSATYSNSVTFDGLDITTNYVQDGIDIFGNGNVTNLANIVVTNCYLHACSNGITIQSIGATISNNMIDGFAFAAVQIDIDEHNACEAGYVHVVGNYFRRLTGTPTGGDGTAVYVDSHWCSTGNVIENNLFWNEDISDSRIMIYLDIATSNQVVQNNIGVNIGGGRVFKINDGSFNTLVNNVMVNVNEIGTIGCENGGVGDRTNCNNDIGQWWYSHGSAYSAYTDSIPWWSDWCTAKSYNGTQCTTSSAMDSAYGGCSGVPHGNKLHWIVNGLISDLPQTLPAKDIGQICPAGQTNAAELNTFTTDTFTGDVFSVQPSVNALPKLSSSFISAYPQFATFIEGLGPNGKAAPPSSPSLGPSSSAGVNNSSPAQVSPSSGEQKSSQSTTHHPSTTTTSISHEVAKDNTSSSSLPEHSHSISVAPEASAKAHATTPASAHYSSVVTTTSTNSTSSQPAAAAADDGNKPQASVHASSGKHLDPISSSSTPSNASMTILLPPTGPSGGAMVTMICKPA